MENNYNEPRQDNSYDYGQPTEAPAAGPDTYSYEELPPTGQQIPPEGHPYQDQSYQNMSYDEPKKAGKTWMPIAALVLGIISIVLSCTGYNIITGIIAIIFGAIYMSKKQPERRGMAIAGLVLGIVSIVIFVIFIIVIVVFAVSMFSSDPAFMQFFDEIMSEMY